MWEALKNLLVGATDALGIEVPELPIDLAGAGEAVATAAPGIAESAAGAVGPLVGEAIDGAAQSVADLPAAVVDSAAQILPDIDLGSAGRSR